MSFSSSGLCDSIENRLRYIKNAIPPTVKVLAVSKNNSAETIRYFSNIGQISFGENRVQEALSKQELLVDLINLDWHFIGRIQSNKVRKIVINFNTIHSVSNLSLVTELQRISIEEQREPDILLQIKLSSDPNKVGFTSKELLKNWHILASLKPLNLIGLMIIVPLVASLKKRRKLFADCRKLIQILDLQKTSMGMSNDWREAVVEGSNYVRVGSSLFGNIIPK
ncbi:MAG TPA: YggS family pyridoxal phosphate-dependent enzyme [Prochlorococcaceae cyanobacterium AMR_MDS_5431]|nr:YggS family pyridoxal phosphate-dependent enzyme [Prochlorococcaceae cyanobacterium AMR_MDS_5431]